MSLTTRVLKCTEVLARVARVVKSRAERLNILRNLLLTKYSSIQVILNILNLLGPCTYLNVAGLWDVTEKCLEDPNFLTGPSKTSSKRNLGHFKFYRLVVSLMT